jgi:hypothetical protein
MVYAWRLFYGFQEGAGCVRALARVLPAGRPVLQEGALASRDCMHNALLTPENCRIPSKFRLFRRRLTISSPRMAVRSALPWPLRWTVGALMMGFSAAIALWAFEVGQSLAGLDSRAKEELAQLRQEAISLRSDREAQLIANTADSLLTAEKALQQKMLGQIRQMELDNRSLRDDLGFL